MRYGLLLGIAMVLSLSLSAMGGTLAATGDSIIIGNVAYTSGQNQASVPVYFVTHGEVTHYNLPLVIESTGEIQFSGHEILPALQDWDDHWQGLKGDHMKALEMGFADLGGDDNPSLNTNGKRVEALRLIFTISDNATIANAPIRAMVDERSGPPLFGYKDGVTGTQPVVIDGSLVLNSGDVPPEAILPKGISLSQNYPNPFNPTTEIKYALSDAREVKLTVFNVLGQTIRNLVSEPQQAGYHKVIWNGCDDSGNPVPSGAYFYKLEAGNFSQSMKMVLLK